jgi:hypothetical protein
MDTEHSDLGRRAQFMMRLFSDLQTARYNELYYQKRADSMRCWVLRMNMFSALASAGALVTIIGAMPETLGFKPGPFIAGCLTVGAAICAAIGPVLGLESKATQLEKAGFGYCVVRSRLKRLLNTLQLEDLESSHIARDEEITAFREALSALDEAGVEKVKGDAWKQTLSELPSDSAWSAI